MEKKAVIGNVCFLQDKDRSHVLLLERHKEPLHGKWTGVGGKTEFCEDIKASCIREVKEETGLEISQLKLKGVVKTILSGGESSWILFLYWGIAPHMELQACNEGILRWVALEELSSYPLIGFIDRLLPHVLSTTSFVEGTFVHDAHGSVLDEVLCVTE